MTLETPTSTTCAKIKPQSLFGDPVVVLAPSTVEPRLWWKKVILVIEMKIWGWFSRILMQTCNMGDTPNYPFQY